MNPGLLTPLLVGATAALAFVAGLFFLAFWRSTGDRFFLLFAASFWIEAGNRVHMGLTAQTGEDMPLNYCVRLLSYALILIAIWDKNRSRD